MEPRVTIGKAYGYWTVYVDDVPTDTDSLIERLRRAQTDCDNRNYWGE